VTLKRWGEEDGPEADRKTSSVSGSGGTAVPITADGYFLTNAHVVGEEGAPFYLWGLTEHGMRLAHARVAWRGAHGNNDLPDLALLQADLRPLSHFRLERAELPPVEAQVIVAGYGGMSPNQAGGLFSETPAPEHVNSLGRRSISNPEGEPTPESLPAAMYQNILPYATQQCQSANASAVASSTSKQTKPLPPSGESDTLFPTPMTAFPRSSGLLSLLLLASTILHPPLAAEVHHAQGEMAGEPTASSVLLQSRLTAIPGPELDAEGDIPGAAGVACFEWGESPDFAGASRTPWLPAEAASDFIVRASLEGLKPGTTYHYRLVLGTSEAEARPGPARSFRTLPDPVDAAAELSFIMGSCQNYAFFMRGKDGKGPTAAPEDLALGFPAYAAMLALRPDFFIGTGDIVYYDHPAKTAAKTLPELRRKWHEQFRLPRLVEFFGVTPAYWAKDDHDFRYNDADLGGAKLPDTPTGIGVFREQMPIHPADDADSPTYRTHRVQRHLQLWFVEGRDYRSPNDMPDGPDKTIWGAEQRGWLQRTLAESDATWKIIVSPTPLVGPDRDSKRDNHTNTRGFRHEGESFLAWLAERGMGNVMSFCGDRHWQYHSVHPTGFEEFSCGALNDENAIPGERPGGPKTTDPEGLVEQRFLYPEPTGGFLHITVGGEPASLRIAFVDDEGKVLHEAARTAP
jgi:alkaline phosphatase D